jgi:CheY-like chemotaxis protein
MPPTLILVVDDNESCRAALLGALSRSGFEAIAAENGRAALGIARERRPDMILMDLMMPEMDGWQALAALRQDPAISTIPVVACTASAPDRDRVASAGFAGCLAKPTRLAVLLDVIQTHCSGPAIPAR